MAAKAFTYKLNRFLKVLEQEEVVPDALVSLMGDKANAADRNKKLGQSRDGAPASAFQVHLIPAWSGADDFWLFRKKVYAKKYQEKWLIEIIGPSPAAGMWESAGNGIWRWKSRAGFDFFDVTPGNWEFKGKEPQYSWVLNRWGFVSEEPSLQLVRNGKLVYSRFHLRDASTLEVAHNSDYAKSIFQKIKDTYDRDYLLKADARSLRELQGKLTPDEEIPWADKTNSMDLQAADWNVHDLSPEEAREWGKLRIHGISHGCRSHGGLWAEGNFKKLSGRFT